MLLQGAEFLQEGAFNDWQALEWENYEKHGDFTLAHAHLAALRRNQYGNSAGLLGQYTEIIHQDDTNHVIAFRRWSDEPKSSVFVLANFSDVAFHDYHLPLPSAGAWEVRFNSTWKGYSKDFPESTISTITADDSGHASIALAPYMVLIASQ